MRNYNLLFSVFVVILGIAFVFTCSAVADPVEEKLRKNREDKDPARAMQEERKIPEDFKPMPKNDTGYLINLEDFKPVPKNDTGYLINLLAAAPKKPAALSRVQVSQLRPNRSSAGTVVFMWTTKSEMENAGFNILRSETRNGPFKPINSALIQGAGTTKKKQTYHWTDVSAKPNVVYYYQLETISFAGTRQRLTAVRLHGHVSASGKIATRWAMLKARR